MQWHLYGEPQQLNNVLASSKGSIPFVIYSRANHHLLLNSTNSTIATDFNRFLKKAHILVLAIRNQEKLFHILDKWKKYHSKGAKLILLEGNQIGLGDKVNYFLNQQQNSFEVISLYINKISDNNFRIILGGKQGTFLNQIRKDFAKLHHTIFLVKRKEAEYITHWYLLKKMVNKAFLLQIEKELNEQGLDIEVVKKGKTIYHLKNNKLKSSMAISEFPYAISNDNRILYYALEMLNNERKWLIQQIKHVEKYRPIEVIAIWGCNKNFKDLLKLPYQIQWYQPPTNIIIQRKMDKKIVEVKNPYDSVCNADLLIILKDDDQFASIRLDKIEHLLNNKIIIDTVNLFDLHEMRSLNWIYISKGRKPVGNLLN